MFHTLKRTRIIITHILLQHLHNVLNAVRIARKFVAHLCCMYRLTPYFILAFTHKFLAYTTHDRHHNLVEQVMALYIKIGSVGRNAKLDKLFFKARYDSLAPGLC